MKISVVGNIAGGKTRISRALAQLHDIEVIHVDHIQFIPPMSIRPLQETRKILTEISQEESWIIDGYGPLDLIESRFANSDWIVFIDLPFWRHVWWFTKRQVFIKWWRRKELPAACDEASFKHTRKLVQTLWRMNQQMLPQLRRMLEREALKEKVITIQNLREWNQVCRFGIKKGRQSASLD